MNFNFSPFRLRVGSLPGLLRGPAAWCLLSMSPSLRTFLLFYECLGILFGYFVHPGDSVSESVHCRRSGAASSYAAASTVQRSPLLGGLSA